MSRRHPRLSECKTMNDFVRGGFAQAELPTAHVGAVSYGTGLYLPLNAQIDYGQVIAAQATPAYTIATRVVCPWAAADNVGHGILAGISAAGMPSILLAKSTTNKWAAITGSASQIASAVLDFAAGTTHHIVIRVTSEAAGNMNHDGTDVVETTCIAMTDAVSWEFGQWPVNNRDGNCYVGPAIIAAGDKGQDWTDAIQADNGEVYSHPDALLRDFMVPGDFLFPFAGNTVALRKVAR